MQLLSRNFNLPGPSPLAHLEGTGQTPPSFLTSLPPYFLASLPPCFLPLPITSHESLYHFTP